MDRIVYIETPRMLMTSIILDDAQGILDLDGDPEVHKYLPDPIKSTLEEARVDILNIQKQYKEVGIGRYALIRKSDRAFLGWSGLRLESETINGHTNYIDVGYRLIQKFWGMGYATESAIASVAYAFQVLGLDIIYGEAEVANTASCNVLRKSGMIHVDTYDDDGYLVEWYELTKEHWQASKPDLSEIKFVTYASLHC